jgi:hypothetical protein
METSGIHPLAEYRLSAIVIFICQELIEGFGSIQVMNLDEGGPKRNPAFREVQKYTSVIQRRIGEIFSTGKDIFRAKIFLLLMTIAGVGTLAD